jgi:hypothetical protein
MQSKGHSAIFRQAKAGTQGMEGLEQLCVCLWQASTGCIWLKQKITNPFMRKQEGIPYLHPCILFLDRYLYPIKIWSALAPGHSLPQSSHCSGSILDLSMFASYFHGSSSFLGFVNAFLGC